MIVLRLNVLHSVVISGIEGHHVIFDDIIIAVRDSDEHDGILRALLQCAHKNSVKFNKQLLLKVNTAKYVSHLLTAEGIKPDPQKIRQDHS